MTNLKIPSIYLKLVGGFHKGYQAEYVSHTKYRDILLVRLGDGRELSAYIEHILFLMDDGRTLKYVPSHTGFSLVEINKNREDTKIVKFVESDNSPSRRSPIFSPNLENMEIENVERFSDVEPEEGDEGEIDYGEVDEYPNESIIESYEDTLRTYRNSVVINDDDMHALFMSQFFEILGIDMDKTSISHHSKILKDATKNSILQGLDISGELLRIFVVAYIFIYINNMGIGYPITIENIKFTPNDDPKFVREVALATNFIENSDNVDNVIIGAIQALLEILQTKIIPSDETNNIGKRFSLLRVSKKAIPKAIPKKITKKITKKFTKTIPNQLKMLRFPIYDDTYKKQSEIKAKEVMLHKIYEKIKKTKNNEEKVFFENLKSNFDSYVKGPIFKKLNTNTDLIESKTLLPYIKEYKARLEIEEEKFYNHPTKTTVKNASPSRDREIFEKTIMSDLNEQVRNSISDKNTEEENKILKYLLKYSKDILNMTITEFKEKIEVNLITASSYEEKKIKAIQEYRSDYFKILQSASKTKSQKEFSKKRKNYEKTIETIDSLSKRVKVSMII